MVEKPQVDAPYHPSPKIRQAMQVLLDAYRYAEETNHDLWEFAVEIDELRAAGLNKTDLRWLKIKEYVETGNEITSEKAIERKFEREPTVHLDESTCFVPTAKGLDFAYQLRGRTLAEENERLQSENQRMVERLQQAEALIAVERKLAKY